jgi:hypothetical protein
MKREKELRPRAVGSHRAYSEHDGSCRACEMNEPQAVPFELVIEALEERLTPGYPCAYVRRTAGWGC